MAINNKFVINKNKSESIINIEIMYWVLFDKIDKFTPGNFYIFCGLIDCYLPHSNKQFVKSKLI
jgi:hypothetical protein